MPEERPWFRFYGEVPKHLEYPDCTLYEALMATVERTPEAIAWDFLGTSSSYRTFAGEIDRCASALAELGLGPGERFTISMPTSPQAIVAFYAVNKLGAVAAMIHPLSAPPEIAFYLSATKSRFALTLDAFYSRFKQIQHQSPLERLILARIPDYSSLPKRIGFALTKGRAIPRVPDDPLVRFWKPLMRRANGRGLEAKRAAAEPAAILFSGGTTGKPKGILLSNRNFISEGMQLAAWAKISGADRMLAILPIFHGFGLAVCVNAVLMGGGTSILVPQFTPEAVAALVRKKRPSILVGVPTLFDSLSRSPAFKGADLRCLRVTVSGADTLPRPVKERFEAVVAARGGNVKLLEGYGLTEAVSGVLATPLSEYREGSIGVPLPDMLAKIVPLGQTEEAPAGVLGEICISGPAVMLGYLDAPEETARTLRQHPDGRTWLHTGDLGTMDADGFFYFKLRHKRMIKSSGMNVYPAQVEAVLYAHPEVREACVIGVPDASQGQRVKAFVVLKDPARAGTGMAADLIDDCQRQLIKWSCPREVEFRASLPKTLIGKVAYKELEEEANRAAG